MSGGTIEAANSYRLPERAGKFDRNESGDFGILKGYFEAKMQYQQG
jgi:hypothetical protein